MGVVKSMCSVGIGRIGMETRISDSESRSVGVDDVLP